MKHLHLAAGLLISVALTGCGDYGDDGAAYSTGTGPEASTDFNLAVAVPQFNGVSAKLQRKSAVGRAVSGSAPFTALTQDDVRAYVVVPDDSNAAGYREVPINVVEFESLGSGRYRIAIDGQAQVDGFFAITIDGIEFRVPMSRTGSTDEPIDVNALQAALADRLQALLVARGVCNTVTPAQLNTVLDNGEAYMAALDVPSSINNVSALIEFYRVAVSGFIQSSITGLCAPALDSLAIAAVPGTYHALESGVVAFVDDPSAQALTTYIGEFTTQSSVDRQLDTTDTTQVMQSALVERDDLYVVTYASGGAGANGVLTDYSVTFPDVGLQQSTASLTAFAEDASRAALQLSEMVDVQPDQGRGARGFVPGFVVAKTPAYQLLPQGGSLFGSSQTTKSYSDLSQASAGCLTSLGLTSAQLADAQAFGAAAQSAVDAVGATVFAARLQADCSSPAPLAFETNLHVETQAIAAATPLAISDLAGRYALVGLATTQQLSANPAVAGYEGSSTDLLFDIDVEGGMTKLAKSKAMAFQPVSAALGGVDSSALDGDSFSLQLPLDQQQNTLTDGHVQINALKMDGSLGTYTGFVSAAPHNLMALNLSALTSGGGKVGGYALVDSLPSEQGYSISVSGTLALLYGFSGISAVDASNPQDLQPISVLTAIGGVQDLAIDGNAHYAYVAAGSQGLQIIDISNPAAMAVVGSGVGSPTIPSATKVELVLDGQGNAVLALVADVTSNGLLHAVDVRDPAAPSELGSYDFGSNYITSLAVTGSAVLVGSYAQLAVLDLAQFVDSDPQSNSFTLIPNTLSINDYVSDIDVIGATAYLAASYDGIYVLDVSDVANITQTGTLQFSDYADRLSIDGNVAYIALSNEGFSGTAVVDLADLASPRLISEIPAGGENAVLSGYLLVATGSSLSGLVSLDTATPAPQKVASIAGLHSDPIITVAGTTAYQVNPLDGFSTYNIADPANPVTLDVLDTAALGGSPSGVAISGNYAYVATTTSSLVIVDVTDPANLSVVGSPFTLTASPTSITAFSQGTSRFVAVGVGADLALIDVTTPTAPTLQQSVVLNDTAVDIAVSADGLTAYVAGYNTVYVVNMTFIGNAIVSGTVSGVTNVRGVRVDSSYIYAATISDGLQIINVSDLTVAASYYDLQTLYGLRLDGSIAYLLGGFGVTVVDISNVSSLHAVGFVALPSSGFSIAITGQYLLAEGYDGSLPVPFSLDVYQLATTQRATGGIALGVRLPSTTLAATDLVGRAYALAGQQAAQFNNPSTSRQAAFGALAGGNLRFVSVDGAVYPVFDLPLTGMVVSDFSGVLPKLEIRFEQWQAGAVAVDGNGRWSFTLTSGGDTASFAGYVGADGALVGHGALFVADAAQPPVVDGSDTAYPGLVEASQMLLVGVPQ